jgi:hypothetical protein
MSEFWTKYYSALEGATILKYTPMLDGDEYGEDVSYPTFLVKFADGTVDHIEISTDEEGNGPGFIFGLPVPGADLTGKLYVVGD